MEMTQEQTKGLMGYIAAVYPSLLDVNSGNEQDDEAVRASKLMVWHKTLEPYEYADIEQAAIECLRLCKFEPKPADILDALKTLKKKSLPTAKELWDSYLAWLEKDYTIPSSNVYKQDCGRIKCKYYGNCSDTECQHHYEYRPSYYDIQRQQDDYEKLPEIVKRYFIDYKGAMAFRQPHTTQKDISFAKIEFKKWYSETLETLYSSTQVLPQIQVKAEQEVIAHLPKGQETKKLSSGYGNRTNFDPSRLGYKDDTYYD